MVKALESKRQAWDLTPVISRKQATACSCVKCGKAFSEPIELTVRTGGSLETYKACPHCFSRVKVSDNLEKRLSETVSSAPAKAVKETTKDVEKNKPTDCAHFLGYLKSRPAGSPIPDECLTCASIMQCMGFA